MKLYRLELVFRRFTIVGRPTKLKGRRFQQEQIVYVLRRVDGGYKMGVRDNNRSGSSERSEAEMVDRSADLQGPIQPLLPLPLCGTRERFPIRWAPLEPFLIVSR